MASKGHVLCLYLQLVILGLIPGVYIPTILNNPGYIPICKYEYYPGRIHKILDLATLVLSRFRGIQNLSKNGSDASSSVCANRLK